MAQDAVCGLKGSFDHAFDLILEFIDICPPEIWKKNFGGWPVWQQVYHSISAIGVFILPANEAAENSPLPGGVAQLSETPSKAPSKATMKKFAGNMRNAANQYFDGLSDETLSETNIAFSDLLNRETCHASTAAILAGHLLYHLGSCDAALREHGIKGVF